MSTLLIKPSDKPVADSLLCFHCKERCPNEQLHVDEKFFCCEGCKMVYEILNVNNLCKYYELDEQPGLNLKSRKNAQAYAYLDDEEIQEKLLEFNDGQIAQVTFYVPAMHCVSCIWLLEHLYKLDLGVHQTRVNFLKKTVTIQFAPASTSLRRLAALLSSIGYAPEINLGDVDNEKAAAPDKTLMYQIGIAGFAFGNIMLFSFPEYMGLDRTQDPWFSKAFGYLSILLALPVLIYSSKDYLIAAWNGLKTRHINIDIPLALGIVMLFGRSAYEILSHTGGGYMDSFAGLIFLLLTGKWFQQKTWRQLSFERDYKSYFPVAATVVEGNSEKTVPVNRLVPGDIIVIRSHEIIPADGVLLKGDARIDYSFVTGESAPVLVKSGERIFAGGKQLSQSIEISLTRRVSQSYLTRLWNDEAFKTNEKGQTTILADKAGRYFTWLILGVGTAAFVYWAFLGNWNTAVNAFTAVMIVACPCAVALAIPFTLGNIMRILGRHRFYLKNIRVVESFSHVNAVIFDKTGTITNVGQTAYIFHGDPLTNTDKVGVRSLTRHSSHPLSRRLYESMADIPTIKPTQFEEIPGLGIQGWVDGRHIQVGSADFVGAPATSGVFVAVDGHLKGYFEVKTRYRDGLESVLNFFRGKQHVWLLSGDKDQEAARLKPLFPEPDAMLFNKTPHDKLEFVKNLQRHGQKVLMLGDGLNDAGALQQSDTGIVVTEDTNNFTPACDAILHAGAFHQLPALVNLARSGVTIVKRAYLIAFVYNMVGLSYAVTGTLSPLIAAILMPLSSVTIVLFGVLMGNWKATQFLASARADQSHGIV
jgi:Cu+-exporting ATPase